MITELLLWTEAGKGNAQRALDVMRELGLRRDSLFRKGPDPDEYISMPDCHFEYGWPDPILLKARAEELDNEKIAWVREYLEDTRYSVAARYKIILHPDYGHNEPVGQTGFKDIDVMRFDFSFKDLTREALEMRPMDEAIEKVRAVLEGEFLEFDKKDIPIKEIMKKYCK